MSDLISNIKENTEFLTNSFYCSGVRNYSFLNKGFTVVEPQISLLEKSIEIIKSGLYSIPEFERQIKVISAPNFWNDLFLLNLYDEAKLSFENAIKTKEAEFSQNPYKNDILTDAIHKDEIELEKWKLNTLNKIIELTLLFRNLINEAFPDLENLFKLKLQEHNELNKSETKKAAKTPKGKKSKVPEMDLSKFNELFIISISEKQKERFKDDIKTFVSGYSNNQIVALASILHNSVHETVRPKEFKKWLELFCAIIGKETPTAKASKPEVKAEIPKMKGTYYYLFP